MFNQEDMGIFGDTSQGVPNPRVGHVHPYPTRYHGPIWTQPQAGYPYRPATYVEGPFVGYGIDTPAVSTYGRGLVVLALVAGVGAGLGMLGGKLTGSKHKKAWTIGGAVALPALAVLGFEQMMKGMT